MNYRFRTPYQEFIYKRTYSRWLDDENRRETWDDTVKRYAKFFYNKEVSSLPPEAQVEYNAAIEAIYNLQVMPSMRCLWTAGPALEREHIGGYNCAYVAVNNQRVFAEALYILMCGTGVGFSVERQDIINLPTVPSILIPTDYTIVFEDSKLGWAEGIETLINMLYEGDIPQYDLSKIRAKGERLKVFGGRACLTGDTIVYKDRKKARGYNEITIKDLFDMQNSEGKWKHKPNHFKDVKLRSLDEAKGTFFRNSVLEVIDNGEAPVYLIVTENGYRIKATDNHRFMNEAGDYDFLSNFKVGDKIAVNGSKERKTGVCVDCGSPISRRAIRCKPCFDELQKQDDCSPTTARARKECQKWKGEECEMCGHDGSVSELQVHHVDENPHNNDPDNLQTLCEKCHRVEHFRLWTFGDPYSHKYLSFDEIVSIEYVGVERVYDLVMEGPNHNFIANGFVSHNSGPAPLEQLIKFIIRTFQSAQSRKLTSVECHDIMCTIANSVVVGGVRRSATISLSNLSDDRMRHAKDGEFWLLNPQRSLANNSVAYTEKPECTKFIEEWLSLIRSNAGERGIFNREGAQKQQALLGRDPTYPYGTNPCGEIILKSEEFCNLTEVVIRPEDTIEDLKRKISYATLLGCLQATLTDFNFLRDTWKFNVEEERLLGVSLTGILDHPVFNGKQPGIKSWLKAMKREAILSATKWASLLGINTPKAITCVKPSGTVSQLVDSASGIHPRWSPYYIRRVRVSSTDPLAKLLIEAGVIYNPEVGQELSTCSTYVFDFPIKSPDTACYRNELNAIQQLEIWKIFKNYWCDHNPSVTIYVKEDEWLSVGTWVYTNWDFIGGLTFLPVAGGSYPLQPYEEITEETYNTLMSTFPELDFTQLSKYESEDSTHGSREFACTSGVCELI